MVWILVSHAAKPRKTSGSHPKAVLQTGRAYSDFIIKDFVSKKRFLSGPQTLNVTDDGHACSAM
jgi:hypothetical protein